MADVLDSAKADLTPTMCNLISVLWSEWKLIEHQLDELKSYNGSVPLMLAVLVSGRFLASTLCGHSHCDRHRQRGSFPQRPDFAAWLGIVPPQYSTGGNAKLPSSSKRGTAYLRKTLIAALDPPFCGSSGTNYLFGSWLDRLNARAYKNVVAMANKLARIACAVLPSGYEYRSLPTLA